MNRLGAWYLANGRHELAWRQSCDRWEVLVSEVMLAQTQVQRVAVVWPVFIAQFPTVEVAAEATPGDFIAAWGRLGYPRRARRLWETARIVVESGWPHDYRELPGIGRYTAGALRAQVDNDPSAIGIDVNIRRVVQRVRGGLLNEASCEEAAVAIAKPLAGRDRLLALMDLGAMLCTPKHPSCAQCPLRTRCKTRGALANEATKRQAPYKGSLREARGSILAKLRANECVAAAKCDQRALASLVADRLVSVDDGVVTLARD